MANVRTVLVSMSIVVGLAGLAGGVGAQIVPPPTVAPSKTPEYIPPPPPPPNPVTPTDFARGRAKTEPPLVFDYQALAEKNTEGKIKLLTQPAHRAALDRNPFIESETKAKLAAFLAERNTQLERLVISNLDVVLKVDDDGFAKVEAKDVKEEIRSLKTMSEPLRLPGGDLTAVLKKAGVLDDKQARANQKIVLDYTKELFSQIRGDQTAAKAAAGESKDLARPTGMSSARMVYVMQVEETMDTYHKLLLEGAKDPSNAVAGLNLPDDRRTASSEVVVAVKAAKADDDRLAAMRKFMIAVGPANGTEVLNKIVAKRGK